MKAEGGRRRCEVRSTKYEVRSAKPESRSPKVLTLSQRERGPGNTPLARHPLPLALLARFLLIVAILCSAAARAAEAPPAVWLVSTRDAEHCGDLDGPLRSLNYWRMADDCDWFAADAKDFHATDDAAVPTVVFLHGNHTDADNAVAKGWCFYEAIRSQSASRAMRYVIWSWPADRVGRRHRPDAQLKAAYSDVESYYLATWLNQLRPGLKVSLVGHSFGPRIIAGAMHLLAGGQVAGRELPRDTVAAWAGGKRNPVRAVLLAAALDADALAPDSANGLALSLLDRVLITCNGCDRVLRWYPRLYGRGGPQALGRVGRYGIDGSGKIDVLDVSATVGRVHDLYRYCTAPDLCGRWAFYTFLDESGDCPDFRVNENGTVPFAATNRADTRPSAASSRDID
jgi:hypothetical protein